MKKYHNLPKYKFIDSEMSLNLDFFKNSTSLLGLFLLKNQKEKGRTQEHGWEMLFRLRQLSRRERSKR